MLAPAAGAEMSTAAVAAPQMPLQYLPPQQPTQQQQVQGQLGQVSIEPASPPHAGISASALAQQRRAVQQQAFEGLSLEAVLSSARKTKPPSRRQLNDKGGGAGSQADGAD